MTFFKWVLFLGLILHVASVTALADTNNKILRVYGPGGPHHVMEECAELFQKRTGVMVSVVRALPYDLEKKLPEDGDIYYGGAEYMLEAFDQKNPGVLDMSTAKKLHARQIGIIVRKGNPLNIKGPSCLEQKGINLLDVKLERMRHFYNNPADQLRNVKRMEYTGRQGLSAWLSYPQIDAWVTYKSWHTLISDDSDFIEISGDGALRHTPVALTNRTTYEKEAMDFISFLKSDEARLVFAKHGWE